MDLLKPIPENETTSVLKLQVAVENMEKAYKEYNHAVLDVFDHDLSLEESNKLLGSFVDHNLKYENSYIQFIEDIYKLNNCLPVIVDIYLNDLDNMNILRILDTLDYQDKLLFIDLIKNNKSRTHLFSIKDKKILSLFIKLSTRELMFSIFHFTNLPITIVGNFDLSFPIFYERENDFKKYLTIARKNNLFFRNIKQKNSIS